LSKVSGKKLVMGLPTIILLVATTLYISLVADLVTMFDLPPAMHWI